MDQKTPATLEKQVALMAFSALLAGALVLAFTGLTTLGWVIVAYGVMSCCLAYLFASAPYREESGNLEAYREHNAHEAPPSP